MKGVRLRSTLLVMATFIPAILGSILKAEENIVQKEEMTFEKCLKVIKTSEGKLSITPEIIEVAHDKRVALFTLSDGTLTITCNGADNLVIVSTNTD